MDDLIVKAIVEPGDRRVPSWAVVEINRWKELLHLHSWETRTALSPHPDNQVDVMACVSVLPNILTAVITLHDSIPQDITAVSEHEAEYWHKVIIHELCHIFLGRLTDFIEKDIWPELTPSARRLAEATFERELEPVVELMAHILYGLEAQNGKKKESTDERTIS